MRDRAVVLGSAQQESVADEESCRRLGASVVRRRSGGGALLVEPGAQVWVDLFLPAGDRLLEHDVTASFGFLGRAWAAALAALGSARLSVAGAGPPASGARLPPPARWSRLLCFGSLGAGEVTSRGRKVVGLSQRRERSGAWFHSMAVLRDTSGTLVECLALDAAARREALAHLREFSGAVGETLSPPLPDPQLRAALLPALLASLS